MTDKKMVTYKLVDSEGFIEANSHNATLLGEHMTCGCFEGYIDPRLDLVIGDIADGGYINKEELKSFFALVEDKTSNLWDGEDKLEVGMVVKYSGFNVEVLLVKSDKRQVVVDVPEHGMKVLGFCEVERATKSHKEETLDKVMKRYMSPSLDLAFNSQARIADIFDVVYSVMKGEE